MYGLLVGFGLMFDKGQKQSSTLSCDSCYCVSIGVIVCIAQMVKFFVKVFKRLVGGLS